MAAISTWSTTAASNNSASPDGAPEGMNPSGVNDTIRENMAQVRTWYEGVEFRDWGHTTTQASATTFLVATDVTAIYTAGRRIKCNDSSTLYGYVVSSSFSSPNTTVTVSLDSGSLTGSLSSVALGLEPTQSGLPQMTNPRFNEAVNMTATSTELNTLDGITATTAELNILDGVTATATELNYVDGVTSAIQTQLDSKSGVTILTTPTEITTTTTGAWTAVVNSTLSSAGATAAIIKVYVRCASGSAATTDKADCNFFLRETGSGLTNNPITAAAYAQADCSVVGQETYDYSISTTVVPLNGSYSFDYYRTDTTSGGGSITLNTILVGYIVE